MVSIEKSESEINAWMHAFSTLRANSTKTRKFTSVHLLSKLKELIIIPTLALVIRMHKVRVGT